MIKLGTSDISKVYFGANEITKAYLGSTEVYSSASFLLDTYGTAALGLSLDLLSSTYSGNCVNVRNDDDDELGIGFASGVLDTSALLTHCGSGDGFVVDWYGQIANVNVSNSAENEQPKIADSGALILVNGKPCIEFSAGKNLKNTSFSLDETTSLCNSLVAKFDNTDANQFIYASRKVSANRSTVGINVNNVISYASRTASITSSSQSINTNQKLIFTENIGVNIDVNQNGPNANVGIFNTGSDNSFFIGSNGNGEDNFIGKLQEMVSWQLDQRTNQIGIETEVNSRYTIY